MIETDGAGAGSKPTSAPQIFLSLMGEGSSVRFARSIAQWC